MLPCKLKVMLRLDDNLMQDLRKLREQIKTKMATTLSELRNMQQLEDALEQAKVHSTCLNKMHCWQLAHRI